MVLIIKLGRILEGRWLLNIHVGGCPGRVSPPCLHVADSHKYPESVTYTQFMYCDIGDTVLCCTEEVFHLLSVQKLLPLLH